MEPIPEDFHVCYSWRAGSMPPPHHYEFRVDAWADGRGVLTFWPDYPELGSQSWEEPFEIPADSLAELRRLTDEAGVFTRDWAVHQQPPIGGSLEWLDATAGGQSCSVPAEACDPAPARPVFEFMRQLPPEALWSKVRTRHEEYQREYLE